MPEILHLVPYDTVGGVETALRSVPAEWDSPKGPVSLRRAYLVTHSPVEIFPDDWHGPFVSVNHPVAHLKLLRFVYKAEADLVIASLWRSCPTLLLLKAFRPKTRTVLFLHSAVDVHIFDRVLNRAAMHVVDEIWADSTTTLEARVPEALRERTRVLSFLTKLPPSAKQTPPSDETKGISPSFVFWGRLQSEKNLEQALDVFAAVHRQFPDAEFDIIGPDRGALDGLKRRVNDLGLDGAVSFTGALPQDELLARARNYRFYLQTSLFEGMAMSVIEAMGMGLVPVVTPVGEIPRYCIDGHNGIHVTTPEETAKRIAAILEAPSSWHQLSARASEKWADANLFRDDYCEACNALLAGPISGNDPICAG